MAQGTNERGAGAQARDAQLETARPGLLDEDAAMLCVLITYAKVADPEVTILFAGAYLRGALSGCRAVSATIRYHGFQAARSAAWSAHRLNASALA